MLRGEQEYVLKLLQCSMGVGSAPTSNAEDGLSVPMIVNAIRMNGIVLTVYPSLCDTSLVRQELKSMYYSTIVQSVLQAQEGEIILNALASAGFSCIGLKGWELCKLYPHSNMRQMSDLDILVKPYAFKEIRKIMESLGYEANRWESSWKHDGFSKGVVNVEMHKRLTDDIRQIKNWESRIWNRATCERNGGSTRMTPSDFYVFHIVHMHKDFLNGSLGLRRIVDTWLLNTSFGGEDLATAKAELESLGLGEFHKRMYWLARICMCQEPMNEDAETLLTHAFKHGIYGTDVSHKAGRIASMSKGRLTRGKAKSALAAVFLPYDRMKVRFPELEKWPVLLPVCWVKRIAGLLCEGNIARYQRMLDYANVGKEECNEMRRFFQAGGC